jgi:hypothetical protein
VPSTGNVRIDTENVQRRQALGQAAFGPRVRLLRIELDDSSISLMMAMRLVRRRWLRGSAVADDIPEVPPVMSGSVSVPARRHRLPFAKLAAMSRVPPELRNSRPFGLIGAPEPSGLAWTFQQDAQGSVSLHYGDSKHAGSYAVITTHPREGGDLQVLECDLLLEQANANVDAAASGERILELMGLSERAGWTLREDCEDVMVGVDGVETEAVMISDGDWRAYRFAAGHSVGTLVTRGWGPAFIEVRRLDDLSLFEEARRRDLEAEWRQGPGAAAG